MNDTAALQELSNDFPTRQLFRGAERAIAKFYRNGKRRQPVPNPRKRFPTPEEQRASAAKQIAKREAENNPGRPGVFGRSAKAYAEKQAFLRRSCDEGNRIAQQRSDRQNAARVAHHQWLQSLSVAEYAAVRAAGCHRYLPDHDAPRSVVSRAQEPDTAREIHADPHAGTHNGRPIADSRAHPFLDSAEPPEPTPLESLSPAEVRDVTDSFRALLHWALDSRAGLVTIGHRSAAAIFCCRPDVVARGYIMDRQLARSLLAAFPASAPADTLEALGRAGAVFGRVFHWMLQGQSISANGERLRAVAYLLFPALIDDATLAKLGEESAKTRQATNKPVLDFRDKFPGIIALCQRPDHHRRTCQTAQKSAA